MPSLCQADSDCRRHTGKSHGNRLLWPREKRNQLSTATGAGYKSREPDHSATPPLPRSGCDPWSSVCGRCRNSRESTSIACFCGPVLAGVPRHPSLPLLAWSVYDRPLMRNIKWLKGLCDSVSKADLTHTIFVDRRDRTAGRQFRRGWPRNYLYG